MVQVLFFVLKIVDKGKRPIYILLKVFHSMNYLFMCIGQLFEMLAFIASLPATVLSSLAQYFYFAGNNLNNNNEETEEQ